MKKLLVVVVSLLANILLLLLRGTTAQEQCGKDVGGAVCPNGLCCSQWGFCGTTEPWCGDGCQSGPCWTSPPPSPPPPPPPSPPPPPPPSRPDITDIISRSLFEKMLPYRNDIACPARGFYTYDAFIAAARSVPNFATTGNTTIRKRELAAFFAHTSHETTGGWPDAPGGPYAWGYCYMYCNPVDWYGPLCDPGKQYHGRGPIQLSWNYKYGPYEVFWLAINDWNAPWGNPSCHQAMTGRWTPSAADIADNRLSGFGVTINIFTQGLECGIGANAQMLDRIGFYERYCSSEIFDVSPGDNLDCATQKPFPSRLPLLNIM